MRYLDEEAIPYLDRAVALDPALGPAFAWRGIAYVGRYYQDYDKRWLVIAEASRGAPSSSMNRMCAATTPSA